MPEHFLRLAGAMPIPTEQAQLVDADVRDVIRHQAVGVVHGRAGVGKTFAVQMCLEQLDPATTETASGWPLRVVSVVFPHSPTSRQVAEDLARAVLVDPPRGTRYQLQNLVLAQLARRPHLLVVDEAQRLTQHSMEVLRYCWDDRASQLAVLLVGGDGCWEVISRVPMLRSRVFRRRHLVPLNARVVPRLMRRYHPLYRDADPDLLARVDAEFAQGRGETGLRSRSPWRTWPQSMAGTWWTRNWSPTPTSAWVGPSKRPDSPTAPWGGGAGDTRNG